MRPPLSPRHTYQLARTPDLIRQARLVHGTVYKRVGYVDQLVDGMVVDEFVDFSTYFVGVDGRRVDATVRQIHQNPYGYPVLRDFELYPHWPQLMLGATADNTVELSALGVDKSAYDEMFALAPGLYRFMWQRQRRRSQRQRYWLGAIDARLFRVFVEMFHFCFEPIGEPKIYKGSLTVPAVLDLDRVPQYMYDRDPELFAFFMEGLPERFVPHVLAPRADVSSIASAA